MLLRNQKEDSNKSTYSFKQIYTQLLANPNAASHQTISSFGQIEVLANSDQDRAHVEMDDRVEEVRQELSQEGRGRSRCKKVWIWVLDKKN